MNKFINKLLIICCLLLIIIIFLPQETEAAGDMYYCVVATKKCQVTNSTYNGVTDTCEANLEEWIDKRGTKTTHTCYSDLNECVSDCNSATKEEPEDEEDDNTNTSTSTPKEDTSWSARFGAFTGGGDAQNNKSCPASGEYESGILKGVKCNEPITQLDQILVIIKNAVTGFLLPIVGTLFVIMFIVGGLQYVTSLGNDEKMKAGKKTLTSALIGILIVSLSYVIVKIFALFISGGSGGIG